MPKITWTRFAPSGLTYGYEEDDRGLLYFFAFDRQYQTQKQAVIIAPDVYFRTVM